MSGSPLPADNSTGDRGTPEAACLATIGTLHTPWKCLDDCPRNGRQKRDPPLCSAIIDSRYSDGLRDIEGFSHLILLYWLHAALSPQLRPVPRFDPEPRGIFATRSPRRPNPIGLSVVAFEGFDAPHILRVRHLDCLDGTRLLDIKPYLRTTDSIPEATLGWLAPHARPE